LVFVSEINGNDNYIRVQMMIHEKAQIKSISWMGELKATCFAFPL